MRARSARVRSCRCRRLPAGGFRRSFGARRPPTVGDALASEPPPGRHRRTGRPRRGPHRVRGLADLKSPWIRGHSHRVASLAEEAGPGSTPPSAMSSGASFTISDGSTSRTESGTRRDSHDLGVGAGPADCTRTTQSGSSTGTAQCVTRRAGILAPRTHRRTCPPPSPSSGGTRLAYGEAEASHARDAEATLYADAVACVLAAAGRLVGRAHRPGEAEVLRLIARAWWDRDVARQLFIAPKTAGRHVENLYRKIGVS
jgi:hypothetical protein